jgi:hypothetical protein
MFRQIRSIPQLQGCRTGRFWRRLSRGPWVMNDGERDRDAREKRHFLPCRIIPSHVLAWQKTVVLVPNRVKIFTSC